MQTYKNHIYNSTIITPFLIFRHHIPVLPNKETWRKGKKALPLHPVLFT